MAAMAQQGNLSGGSEYVNGQPRPGGTNPYGVAPGPNAAQLSAAWSAYHPGQVQGMMQAPMTDYASMFQNALSQARSGIQQQYGAALGDIANSQAAAGQALGTLPGEVNRNYGQAFSTMGNAQNALTAAQQKSGVGSNASLSAYMAPVSAAVHGSQAAALANVPLLKVGIGQAADQRRAAAQMAEQGDMNTLNGQEMQFAMSQAAAQQQAQAAQQSAMQQYLYQKQLQDDPNRNFGPSSTAGSPDAQVVDPKTGLPMGFTTKQLTEAQKTGQYQRAAKELQSADPKDVPMIWHQLTQLYGDRPEIVAALSNFFFKGSPPPGGATAKVNSPDSAPGWVQGIGKAETWVPW
jgi:hypothetical protein